MKKIDFYYTGGFVNCFYFNNVKRRYKKEVSGFRVGDE